VDWACSSNNLGGWSRRVAWAQEILGQYIVRLCLIKKKKSQLFFFCVLNTVYIAEAY
jgi:hypothetical protein